MKYFKLQNDDGIIGVVTSNDFISYTAEMGYIRSNDIYGEYVEYNNKYYRDAWMKTPHTIFDYEEVSVFPISENGYQAYMNTLKSQEIIRIEEPEEEIEVQSQEPDVFLETIREMKISEMSKACHKTIENGFDIELRGKIKHFSLSTQDQLNLMSLAQMAQTQSMLPYHADGEEVVFYAAEEIQELVDEMNAFKIYHTTYYNALKAYINSLSTIEELDAVEYGMEIPEEFKTDVLKALE